MAIVSIVFALLAAFQNCAPLNDFSGALGASMSPSGGNGNGDGYNGKPTYYGYFDGSTTCAADGRALPAKQIYVYRSAVGLRAELVRENCRDITPVAIDPSSIRIEASGMLYYASLAYQPLSPGDFDVKTAPCPAGLTPKSGVTRTNLLASSLDFTASPWLTSSGGVGVSLDGTMAGLPAYRITRLMGGASNDWRRVDQYQLFQPSTQYAYSFLAKPGSASVVRFMTFDADPVVVEATVTVDLVTGASSVAAATRLNAVSVSSEAFADGQFVTIFFTTTATVRGGDMGIVSESTNVGDSIIATNAQLESVANYCQ